MLCQVVGFLSVIRNFYHHPVLKPLGLKRFPNDLSKSPYKTNECMVVNSKAGLGVKYKNHTLRATAITGIPEKVIAKTPGHKSSKALRYHKCTSAQQQAVLTVILLILLAAV